MDDENSQLLQWKEWNAQGLFPGPNESAIEFEERITFCLNLETHLMSNGEDSLPFEMSDAQSKEKLNEAFPLTKKLYGIEPKWVPIFFSNHQLASWHGGCAWIFQLSDKTPTSAFLQLRASFRNSSTFLKIYQRKELIAHELSHVGRMLYQEPKYEEIFAYQSSSSSWRRFFGPIVQSSKESLFFIFLLGFAILADLVLISMGSEMATIAWGLKLLPVIFFFIALLRLQRRQKTYKTCMKNLEKIFSTHTARHLLYRLQDSEIERFSRFSEKEILNYIEESSKNSFRWIFLKTLYR